MLSKSTVGYLAAGAGLAFLGYCVYFDHKRRNAPDFRMKLRERRRKARQAAKGGSGDTQVPDLNNPEAMQRFFLQELTTGEELLGSGNINSGVEHLSNAIAICGQPEQLINAMQQTLPREIIQMILQQLPQARLRIASSATQSLARSQMAEDDMD